MMPPAGRLRHFTTIDADEATLLIATLLMISLPPLMPPLLLFSLFADADVTFSRQHDFRRC
jgi:hypothetical protein